MDLKLSCRACMKILPKTDFAFCNIESIKELFTSCSNLQFDDCFLPKYLCQKCYKTCIEWKNFIKQCEKSQNKFVEYLTLPMNNAEPSEEDPLKITQEDIPSSNEVVEIPAFNNQIIKIEPKEEPPEEFTVLELLETKIVPEPIQIIVKKNGQTRNEPTKQILKCTICKLMFANLKAYENHYENSHTNKSSEKIQTPEINIKSKYKCAECRKIFNNLDAYEIHYNKLHNIFCSVCKYAKFKSVPECFEHQKKVHSVLILPVIFKCNICDLGFNLTVHYKYHMKKFHNLEEESKPKYECSKCLKEFISKSNLNKHLLNHFEIKKNVCEYCGKSFRAQSYLKRHILLTHKLEANLQCHLCRHKFKTQQLLDKHVQLHLSEKNIQCEFCPLKFKKQNTYKNHRMVHTGEKNYFCSICNHGFIQHTALKAHMKVH